MLDRFPKAAGIRMRRVEANQPLLGGLYPGEAVFGVSTQRWRNKVTHMATMRSLERGRNR